MALWRRIGAGAIGLLVAGVLIHGALASEGITASATGSGGVRVQNDELRIITFSANRSADGIVKGEIVFMNKFTEVTSHADVNCLNIGHQADGTVAVLSGIITKSNQPIEGLTGVIAVQDRGAGNEVDRITGSLSVGTRTCDDFVPDPSSLPLSDLDTGSVRVDD